VPGGEEHLEDRSAVAVVFLFPPIETSVPAWADGALVVPVDGEVGAGGALVLPGLAAAVVRGRAEQFHTPIGRGQEQGGSGAAGIHDMHLRQQLPCRERLVDRFGHLRVGHHCSGGCHLRDHVRRIRLTRLGQMRLVAGPARAVLDPVTGIGVIGRAQPVMNRREVLALPPAHPPLVAVVLLDPGDPQDMHRLDLAQPVRSRRGVDRLQQDEPVPSDLLRPLFTDLFAPGEAVVVHARP
jgi:hypothetical protein